MKEAAKALTLASLAVVAACAAQKAQMEIPSVLVPAGDRVIERVAAKGVQIYECRAGAAGAAPAWAFVAPEADLFDASGRKIGTHYAGPHWEAADGSKIVGAVKARADAPNRAADIPWLLLSTKSVGGAGRFAGITNIQRVETGGGVAPAGGCDAASIGARKREPYVADYVMLAP